MYHHLLKHNFIEVLQIKKMYAIVIQLDFAR